MITLYGFGRIDLMGAMVPTGAQRRPRHLANDELSVGDLLLANVLRQVRKTGLLDPDPRLLRERSEGRPAWKRRRPR